MLLAHQPSIWRALVKPRLLLSKTCVVDRGLDRKCYSMTSGVDAVIVHVTAPDEATAKTIAVELIENKLAACVQRIPGVESTYSWEERLETSQEMLLLIKTRQALVDKVTQAVTGLHPYAVPEILTTPVSGGSLSYLRWMEENTRNT